MKIEIGESILASYLKHIRGCQIVQTNFKASPAWQSHNHELANELFNNATARFNTDDIKTIKGSGMAQFLRQAEIDVIGYDCINQSIIAADIAFHEAGLNYRGKGETERRVIKKILRTVLCLIYYFDKTSGEIIFAAPKVHGTFSSDKILQKINDITSAHNLNFKLRILCGESFKSEIFDKVMAEMNHTDTSDLFVRSAQLIRLMERSKSAHSVCHHEPHSSDGNSERLAGDNPIAKSRTGATKDKICRIEDEKKIALSDKNKCFAMRCADLLQKIDLTDNDFSLLFDADMERVKRELNSHWSWCVPILRDVSANDGMNDQIGKRRYYDKVFHLRDTPCRITNDWYYKDEAQEKDNRTPFLNWLLSKPLKER